MSDLAARVRPGHLSNATQKRLSFAVLIVLVGLAGLIFIRNLVDFPVYYAAGQSLLAGRIDLYSPDFARGPLMDYRYPPLFLLAFTPLWLLPYWIAAYLWYLLGVLEIAGCFVAIGAFPRNAAEAASPIEQSSQSERGWRDSRRIAVWGLTLAGVAPYVVMNLHYGNAQMITTFLVFGSLYLATDHSVAADHGVAAALGAVDEAALPGGAGPHGRVGRRGREVFAALLLALAITIKVTPALLLAYLAMKQRWRLLLLTGSFIVALNLAPSLYFGPAGNARLLGEWYRHVVADQEFHEINGPVNLSLKGQLHRSLTEIDYGKRLDGDSNYPSVNLVQLSSGQVDRIWIVLASCLFAATLIWIWRAGLKGRMAEPRAFPPPLDPNRRSFLEIGLMICVMLLVEPLTSKIYFVALMWPLWALLELGYGAEWSARRRVIRTAAALLAMVNVALPLLPGRSIQRLLLVLGTDFYLTCAILVLGLYALVSNQSEIRSRAGEPQMPYPQAAKTP
jgi:hypothetical protein